MRMERIPDHPRVAKYLAQVAAGLIPFGVLAVSVHAYVAAEAIVATVIVIATVTAELVLRDGQI
jgi:hypothetical protein